MSHVSHRAPKPDTTAEYNLRLNQTQCEDSDKK